jgi:hypothetical protein
MKSRISWYVGGTVITSLVVLSTFLFAQAPKPQDIPANPFKGEVILVELKGGKSALVKKPNLMKLGDILFIVGEAEYHDLGPLRDEFSGSRLWLPVADVVRLGEYKEYATYDEAVRKVKKP